MDATPRRRALGLSLGIAAGTGLVTLGTGDRPGPGYVLGMALVPVVILAFESLDGPLERQTARIGAVVLSVAFVGAALWLQLW